MKVHHQLNQLPQFKNAVITIGTFDGVHLGHQKLLHEIKAMADENDGESILLTFHPHPRAVINPLDKSLRLLNTIQEKTEDLAKTEIDHVVIAPFSKEFAELPALEYIKDFLVKYFQPKLIVIGYDHCFGKGRKGNFELLEEYADIFGYKVESISAQRIEDIVISSSKVRNALQGGDVQLAADLLGKPYRLSGFVVKGYQMGRKLGFPTANIRIDDPYKLIPFEGVYAVVVETSFGLYKGMLNIGFRPTFDGFLQTVEVNLFDFNQDLYGERITVSFINRIRPEQKFDGPEALATQLQKDEITAKLLLEKI